MSDGTADKIKGQANEAIGKVKRKLGETFNDQDLKDAGNLQEAKGDVQTAVGKAKDAIEKVTKP